MASHLKSTRKVDIELPVLLICFAAIFSSHVTTNLIIYRTCYVTLGYKESDCALLGKDYSDNATAELEAKVQPYTTTLLTVSGISQAIGPPIICFFVGPWTDVHGRKPLLLASILGSILMFMTLLIVSSIPSASPWFILLYLIPNGLTGGIPSLATAVLCYINDVTNESYRGLRMAVFESLIHLGSILGGILSSLVLNAGGYLVVYTIACTCATMAWIFVLLVIPESVENVKNEGKIRDLFRLSLLTAAVKTATKKRKHRERTLLLIIVLMMIFALFTFHGNNGVIFLFLRRKFQWTLGKFTVYNSIIESVVILGTVTGILLMYKILHIKESIVILCGFVSTFSSSLFQGLANESWQMYLAGTFKFLNGTISPMGRCLLSKLIAADDAGKLFSLLTALEAMAAFVGITVYTNIYNSTLKYHPEAYNFVSVGIYSFEIVLVGIIFVIERYRKRFEVLESRIADLNGIAAN